MNDVNSVPDIVIIGAGVCGLTCAAELADRGFNVRIFERSQALGEDACSWYAGGMLAPWCERESAEQPVLDMGMLASNWWSEHIDSVTQNGSLVLAPARDQNELQRFARLTRGHRWLEADQVAELEPDLADAFGKGLFFEQESHIHPRQAMRDLAGYLKGKGVQIQFGEAVSAADFSNAQVVDCRGFSARDDLPELRGVKGEMLILKTAGINLSRPVRLLHPRYPVYVVPRGNGEFMLGATMIENDERNRITALSMLELLSAAYALHSGFGEAEIVEIGVDVRPAFNDNAPALSRRDNVIFVNGLYRHGFLLGPAMAMKLADALTDAALFRALPLCA